MKRRQAFICGLSVALALLGGQLSSETTAASATEDHPGTPSNAAVWCLDPVNAAHLAATADSLGEGRQNGHNIIVGGRILSIEQWKDTAEGDFNTACEEAFELYGPPPRGGDAGLENWEIALVSALGGAGVGAAGSYVGSAVRDRKLWIRQDAATIRRLAGEIHSGVEILGASSPKDLAGIRSIAQVQAAIRELESILDEKELRRDEAAGKTRRNIAVVLGEIKSAEVEQRDPRLDQILKEGRCAGETARDNARRWAEKINPKVVMPSAGHQGGA